MTMSLTQDASQATQVEQARAVAEVAAAVHRAEQRPRDEDLALARFKRSCARKEFAERAFFRYRRAGEQITGATIAFAQEAQRCWGNMVSGSSELARRATASEMIAFAWDLETNTQRRTTFVSPHSGYVDTPKFETDGAQKPARRLLAVRDVRENNQSVASRVEREMILAVLPAWFVEIGKAACLQAVAGDASEPIEDRRRSMIEWYEQRGIRRDELVDKIGAPVAAWLDADLATLRVIGQSITRGETTTEAEFRSAARPAATLAQIGETAAPVVDTAPPAAAQGEAPADGEPAMDTPITKRTQNAMFAAMTGVDLGGKDAATRAKRLRLTELLTGKTLGSSAELTDAEGQRVVAALGARSAADVVNMLADDERAAAERTEAPSGAEQ